MSKYKTLAEYKERYYPKRCENEENMNKGKSVEARHFHGTRLSKEARRKIVDQIKTIHA